MFSRKGAKHNQVKNSQASKSDRVIIKNDGKVVRITRKGK